MKSMQPCVYILASRSRVLYVGVTRDLRRRWEDHQTGNGSLFVKKYRVLHLVHVETCSRLVDAIRREKEVKAWRREKKVALIRSLNPGWRDLAVDWGWSESRAK